MPGAYARARFTDRNGREIYSMMPAAWSEDPEADIWTWAAEDRYVVESIRRAGEDFDCVVHRSPCACGGYEPSYLCECGGWVCDECRELHVCRFVAAQREAPAWYFRGGNSLMPDFKHYPELGPIPEGPICGPFSGEMLIDQGELTVDGRLLSFHDDNVFWHILGDEVYTYRALNIWVGTC